MATIIKFLKNNAKWCFTWTLWKLKNKNRRKLIRFQGFQGPTFMFFRVRKKTSKSQGFRGTFQEKEKIQGIFKGVKVFKDRWPPCSTDKNAFICCCCIWTCSSCCCISCSVCSCWWSICCCRSFVKFCYAFDIFSIFL